jgi:hypothetical protein
MIEMRRALTLEDALLERYGKKEIGSYQGEYSA